MQARQISNRVRFDVERLGRWDQLKAQLRVGGLKALVPMARGGLARTELGLEGAALRVPQLRSAVDFVNARRMETAWRHEATHRGGSDLGARERRKYSQNGEDGILEWIFDLVGTTNRSFIEIGASDGEENCTRSLVESGWTGIWIEADTDRARRAREVAAGRVVVLDAPAEPSTIAAMLRRADARADPDLVVLDIDGNDWWLLYAVLLAVSPRVLVVEYNSTYQPGQWWVEPYRQGFTWDQSFRHGASLDAMTRLAATFGFVLLGCNSTGVNSFYVSGETLRAGGLEAPGRIGDLYRGPWFAPGLWGHPRQRHLGATTLPTRPLSDDELSQISIDVSRWPTRAATRRAAGQPVVVETTITNGTDKLLTSEGGTPFHLASRWRSTVTPRPLWADEPRVKIWPVQPHGTVHNRLWRRAPSSFGHYYLELCLVQENVRWLDRQAVSIELEVDR